MEISEFYREKHVSYIKRMGEKSETYEYVIFVMKVGNDRIFKIKWNILGIICCFINRCLGNI